MTLRHYTTQGTGPKNASSIIEEILLSHLVRCRGESIKVIVSENAAVGKNWLTTIALPQYFVDQGLAEIVLVIFLENNHGKWLADMLFGQFQSRRRREVLFGIDDLLTGFEDVRRRDGKVLGFALNPLSSINFFDVFKSLGYQTRPPSDFGFTKRNIHFSGACAKGAKNRLPIDLMRLLASVLPDDPGMVRISTEPPGAAQSQLNYEDRYLDVPAARISSLDTQNASQTSLDMDDDLSDAPLAVPLHAPYSPNGNRYGVVSHRTAHHVGYNGLEFRKLAACPEMRDTSKPVVRQAWPKGLLHFPSVGSASDEPVSGCESQKCAPLNWIARRPVRHFWSSDNDWKSRYPPRNLLNAKFQKGPRDKYLWKPVAIYMEPPMPIIEGTAACAAMKELAEEHNDIGKSLHILDALRKVYQKMEDRDGVADKWLQRKFTSPSRRAIESYRSDMQIYLERESGHPQASKTIRQIFKEDSAILEKTDRLLREQGISGAVAKKTKNKTITLMYEEAENTPGGLDRFYHLVEKDQERYARELKEFRKKQEQFDRENCLLPTT